MADTQMVTLAIKTEPYQSRATVKAEHFARPTSCRILEVALNTCPETTDGFLWLTCGDDSHDEGLHPTFDAFDFRTSNIIGSNPAILDWCEEARSILGRDYDIIFETNHVHVEYDPK